MRKFIESKLGRLTVAAVIAVGAVVGISVAQANAADDCTTLTYPLCPRSVASSQIVDGSIIENDLNATVRNKLNAPDEVGQDLKGDSTLKAAYSDKIITNTGGSWLTRRTSLGSFVVPAGTWNITASVQFQRIAAADAGVVTRPQLALRVGTTATSFGDSVGTIGGNDISPVLTGDLFGQDSRLVTFTEPTTVEVSAFGYQDDRGSADSGRIKVIDAQIVVTAG